MHLICPDTSSFSELSNQPEKSLFIIHWYQECPSLVPCGQKVGMRYSAAFLRWSATTGSTPHQLNLPRHLTFFRIVKPARKSLLILHWYQECPSLVPCGPKVGRPYSAAFLRRSATTGSTPHPLNLPKHITFFRIVKPARKSLFIIHWYQECPSLVPCGPKVGRR